MTLHLKKLGPGILFAGAAVGVSHLVQSTRAGADFGMGFLWALLLVNLFKYPFFQFGPRYAAATGESLLDGYIKLGRPILMVYFILNLATMFTIQAAVTIVTAGLASSLFGDLGQHIFGSITVSSLELWTLIILTCCFIVLFYGHYRTLDKLMKVIISLLSLSTVIAVMFAFNDFNSTVDWTQILPNNAKEIGFLIAFMGWMPAPLDISVWHSLWTIEKQKDQGTFAAKSAILDFNFGFIGATVLGFFFLCLGYFVLHDTGTQLSNEAGVFANQLIDIYTSSLGYWAYTIIAIAAFTTMVSTTITTLDASPRAMTKSSELILNKSFPRGYLFWLIALTGGTLLIFFTMASEMGLLIQIATVLSFITAPFYGFANYKLITSRHTPEGWRPKLRLRVWSWMGLIFLTGFTFWYLSGL